MFTSLACPVNYLLFLRAVSPTILQEAQQAGGSVLVHCIQGVSRSVTFVIAYLMWQSKKPYGEIFEAVKGIRGVANPNIGFCFQVIKMHAHKHSLAERK